MASSQDEKSGPNEQSDVDLMFPELPSKEKPPVNRQSLFPVKAGCLPGVFEGNYVGVNSDWLQNKSFLPTAALLAQEETSKAPVFTSSSPHQTPIARDADGKSSLDEQEGILQAEISSVKRSQSASDSDGERLLADKRRKAHAHSSKKTKEKRHKKKKKYSRKQARSMSPPKDIKTSKPEELTEFWRTRTTKTFLEEIPGLEPQFAFRLDRKSEKSLWDYESLCKGHIARYSRSTHNCLGNMEISLHQKDGKHKDTVCRYYTKDKRKEIRIKGTFVTGDKKIENNVLEYISIKEKDIKSICSAVPEEESNPLGYLDHNTCTYSQDKGLAVKYETEEESFRDEMFEKTAYYNRCLHDDPNNVKLWLEFVNFQDLIFQDSRFSVKSVANRRMRDSFHPPRACIEKKLAILNKALVANPSSLELKIHKLEIEQDVMDSTTLAKEWDNLLFVYSADVRLWRHYLTFQQTCLATFNVGRLIKLYHRCFKTLRHILEGKVKVVKMPDNLEEEMMGLFEQYCNFLHHSGFTEKAVASCQALIEFNLFRPSALNLTPTEDSMAVFESFWDSGLARFGEPDAKGWAAWMEGSRAPSKQALINVRTEKEQEEILAQDFPEWQTWLRIERLRQSAHWLPWHPGFSKGETDEDCEDLDRLVLYDDVAPVLFRLHHSTSCLRLVQHFLNLMGLVHWQRLDDSVAEFDQQKLCALHQVPAATGLDVGISVDSTWRPPGEIILFLEEVLRQAASYFSGWQRTLFTCQLLQLQTEKHGSLNVRSLSAEASKEVRRFGKNLLKETHNRSDLLLWDAYIRNEWACGRSKDATSMLQTALTMFTSSIMSEDHAGMAGLYSLYRTMAEISLNFTPTELVQLTGRKPSPSVECKNRVVSYFICLMDAAKFSVASIEAVPAAQILRTRRKFQGILAGLISNIVNLIISSSFKLHVVQLVNCFSLFELCAVGVAGSLQVFDSAFELCTIASQKADCSQVRKFLQDLEQDLTLNLLSLLKNYMTVEAMSLGQFRSRLDTALTRFPDNPSLLRQLVDLESKTCIVGRLRRFFESATVEPASVYPVMFEVLAEMSRHAKLLRASTTQAYGEGVDVSADAFSDTGTVHRVRAACERGLRHKVTRNCPLLWRLYLHFEAKYGSPDRARGVFYRALQTCPWAKVLYLDGAELFGAKQLQELVDLMTEKELRVQIPLEEVELLINSEPQDADDNRHEMQKSVTESL